MDRLRSKLTFANAIALIALFVSLGGTVYAAAKINGKTIKKESIPANRLKADSLGGAQVNEGALAQVPSAGRADEAARAGEAARATSAERATSAARATSAERAPLARDASLAEMATEARTADTAAAVPRAGSADRLGGRGPAALVESCAQQEGSIKASLGIDPTGQDNQQIVSPFNCTGGRVRLLPPVTPGIGEYKILFEGLEGPLRAVASSFGRNSVAVVGRTATDPVTFVVRVIAPTNGAGQPDEKLTLVVF